MFSEKTPESIRSAILSMAHSWDVREGEFASDMVAPVATEMWMIYQTLNALLSIVFVDEGSGPFIDLAADVFGMERRPGTSARALMHFVGSEGVSLNAGTVFLTAGGLEFELEGNITIPSSGTASDYVHAVEAGAAYNIEAGEIVRMYTNIPGLTSFTNDAAEGGTDAESDASLVERYYLRRRRPATSGNAAHYEQWALEVPGVGAVRVIPLEDGPGTVGMILVDSNKEPAAAEIVEAVMEHVEEERPIGPSVAPHIRSAEPVTLDIAATVVLDDTTTADVVREQFVSNLDTYIKDIVFLDTLVLYNRISFLLLSVPGVIDYTALTINGGTANVPIAFDEVAVIGTVEVTK